MQNQLIVSSPGRVCLFGEHQDYLLLPVISAAISLRIKISGELREDPVININLPDINEQIKFSLNDKIHYILERDYFRSGLNVLLRNGFTFSRGFNCTVQGEIPIRAGTSSSSALVVTWIQFLAMMSDQKSLLHPDVRARYAHLAEVIEFNEPGGMMDQYATSHGGVLFIKFFPEVTVEQLKNRLKTFVLGDSKVSKDTKSVLSRVKNNVLSIVKSIKEKDKNFDLQTVKINEIDRYRKLLTHEQYNLLNATIKNRDLTWKALEILSASTLDDHEFGKILNEHHKILRDDLKISTPKINQMIDFALEAGAYGGKINGSGGGGCMFVYAPENPEVIAEEVRRAGGKSYIINIDEGTRIEKNED